MDAEPQPVIELTPRELEILRLVALGLSNRDIGEELFIAPETVRWYTKQIYNKLDVNGRIQAVNRARELGLLQDGIALEKGSTSKPTTVTSQYTLPISRTLFIGRSHELAEVKRLLQTVRLMTLTGVGGTGKTRLALRVASEVKDYFADGVYFIDLSPLSDHNQVTKTIAGVLGIIESATEPQLNTLKRALADRELLLVLDNFEHVIEAASLVSELLVAAPRLKVLVTSREALRLSGEQEYPVPPLSLPLAENFNALTESEAVALFVQHTKMMLPHFEITDDNASAIAQICARLDGLPLAIELATARSKLMSPQAMLSRLNSRLTTLTGGSRDAPARQQTLRRTLDWSYNLLDEGEKTLFARLAVFRGGRSLEAIEAVCGQHLPMDVLDGLATLVDKNLLQQKETSGGEPRFVMLETIHEYARERLAESGDAEVIRRRYAEFFVELAEQAELELRLKEHYRWSQLLERELNNLRAILEWSLAEGEPMFGVRLAGALSLFWYGYGYHAEGQHWVQQLLEHLEEVPLIYHPKFLFSAGMMAVRNYQFDTAKGLVIRGLEISHKFDDRRLTAWGFMFLGVATQETGEAMRAAEAGLALFQELGYKPGIAQTLNLIGEIARAEGDDDRAKQAYEECLIVCQETGETRRIQLNFLNLAFLAQHKEDHTRAIDLTLQGLRLAREMNNKLEIVGSLTILVGSLGARGQSERAAHVLGASEAALERMGAFRLPSDKPEIDRIIAAVRAQLDDTTFQAAWAAGRAMTLEQMVAYALEEQI